MVEAMITKRNRVLPPPAFRDEHKTDQDEQRTTKTVGFNLSETTNKRSKPNPQITARNIVTAIERAMTRNDRLDAIYMACATFDHGIQMIHDEEIKAYADVALCKHLFVLYFKRTKEEAVDTEIHDTIVTLEMLLRCSAPSISIAFDRIGSELLPLLLHEIRETVKQLNEDTDEEEGSLQSNNSNLSEEDTASNNKKKELYLNLCTKIIARFAGVGSLADALACQKNLLSTLSTVIASNSHSIPFESKLNSLWIVSNLACSLGNMIKMVRDYDLVDVLYKVASHPETDEKVDNVTQYIILLRSRSIALRAILNLSWASENKTILAEQEELVELLVTTASQVTSSWCGNGNGVSALLLQSRRNAAGALRNLAAAPRRTKRLLCRYKNGLFLDDVANLASDPDQDVRDKIHATLWNLVTADTAKVFTTKTNVIQIIAKEAMKPNKCTDNKNSSCFMASRTLRLLEGTMPEDDEGYTVLRPIIEEVFDESSTAGQGDDRDSPELSLVKPQAV